MGIGTDYVQDQPVDFLRWTSSQQGTKRQEGIVTYSTFPGHPKGMETPDKFCNIAQELLKRGYNPTDTKKILGGNWLRLFKEVWGE